MEIGEVHVKRLHPVYMAKGDLAKNLKNGNEAMLEASKGIVAFGEEIVIEEIVDYLPK